MYKILLMLFFTFLPFANQISSNASKIKKMFTVETKMKNTDPIKKNIYKIKVEEFTSASGIKIKFIKRKDSEIVTLNAYFDNVGSDYETIPGLSNLLSLALKLSDTKNYTHEDILNIASAKGIVFNIGNFGDAFHFSIQYVNSNQDDAMTIARKVLCDSLLNSDVALKQLVNEYQDNLKNPDFRLTKKIDKAMFGESHPYGRRVSESDYQKITSEQLADCYQTIFSRDKLTVIVTGDFDGNDKIGKIVDEIFAEVPVSKQLSQQPKYFTNKVSEVTPENFDEITEYQEDYRNNKIFFYLTDAPNIKSDEMVPLKIALTAFAQIPLENRLINVLRKKLGKVYYARFGYNAQKYARYFSGSTESSSLDETKQAIVQAFEDFNSSPITDQEVMDAKNYILNARVFSLENSRDLINFVRHQSKYDLDKDHYNSFYEKIQNCSIEEVRAVIEKYFNPKNIQFGIVTKK